MKKFLKYLLETLRVLLLMHDNAHKNNSGESSSSK